MTNVPIPADERTNRRWTLIWLGLCILLALAVRSHDLGTQSLWWDESLSLHRARLPLSEILTNVIDLTDGSAVVPTIDNHPPLYFLVLSLTVRVFGASEFALRLPSLAFGILLIPLLYLVGKRLLGARTGRLAALAGALSPMYLWYSQEARMYMMATFVSLLSFYALLRLLDHDATARRLWAGIYVAATAAMLLTHYLTLFILAVEIIVVIIVAVRSSHLLRWAWPLAFVVLLATGVLLYALSVAPPPTPQVGPSFIALPVLLRDVLNSFSLGLSVNVDDVIFLDVLFLMVVLTGIIVPGARKTRSPLPATLILLLYLAVPLTLTYLAGYVRPVYMNSRHLIVMTPAFYIALAAGLDQLYERRGLFLGVLGVMLVGIIFSWNQYFNNPAYNKDDHRAWGAYLRAYVQPGDVVVINPPHIYDLYEYYAASDAPWLGLPALNSTPEVTYALLDQLSSQYRNIWLATSSTPTWGDPDRIVEKWLDRTLTKTQEREFHSYASIVRLVRYTTRPPLALAPPPISVPASIDLDGRLQFLGYDAVNRTAEPGRSFSFSLYLRSDVQLSGDVKISLRLLDENGQMWAQSDQAIGALQSSVRWREGMIVREDANLLVPLATPEGNYHVEAVVYSAATGQPLRPKTSEQIALGQATVIRPAVYPHPSLLPLTQRVSGCAAHVELIGIHTASEQLHEGDVLDIEAFWQATQAPATEYLARVALVDASGKVRAEKIYPIATPSHGTLTWERGEIVRGQYRLDVPRDMPSGTYTVRISLQDVATGATLLLRPCGLPGLLPGSTIDPTRVTISDRPRSYSIPTMMYPVSANLGDAVTMLGYDVAPSLDVQRATPGQPITVTFYLQARAEMDTNYTIFFHLVDDSGSIWGQQDGPAGGVRHPTTLWLPGEVVSTTLSAVVSPQAPTNRLTAIMGLYDPNTSVRLPVAGSGSPSNSISLFTLQIAR